jgi:hypothetical protein
MVSLRDGRPGRSATTGAVVVSGSAGSSAALSWTLLKMTNKTAAKAVETRTRPMDFSLIFARWTAVTLAQAA